MKIDIKKNGSEILAILEGRLDTVTSPTLEKTLSEDVSQPGINMILDCKSMEYVSSAGLRVILLFHKTITAKGGKFTLRDLTKEVRSVFEMTGFSRILNIE